MIVFLILVPLLLLNYVLRWAELCLPSLPTTRMWCRLPSWDLHNRARSSTVLLMTNNINLILYKKKWILYFALDMYWGSISAIIPVLIDSTFYRIIGAQTINTQRLSSDGARATAIYPFGDLSTFIRVTIFSYDGIIEQLLSDGANQIIWRFRHGLTFQIVGHYDESTDCRLSEHNKTSKKNWNLGFTNWRTEKLLLFRG